jgi:hypothetical protein
MENKMNNIISFPTKFVRDKVSMERLIKEKISSLNLDVKAEEELKQRLLSVWEKYQYEYSMNLTFPLPAATTPEEYEIINSSIQKAFDPFLNGLKKHITTLAVERAQLEIDLYLGTLVR